jgi:hypothetical protein
MPLRRHNRSITRLELVVKLTALPVPKAKPTSGVAAHQELSVGGNINIDGITRIIMSAERLLSILPELIGCRIYNHLVVAALVRHVFPTGMRCGTYHRVHIRLRDKLDRDGDAVFPCAQRFVVGCSDKSAVLVDEGDGIDRAEMVIIFLHHLFCARIELHNFFVGHTSEELVWMGGVEADYVWYLSRREAVQTFAGFGVPKLHVAVVGGGKEMLACGGEGNVGYRFRVAVIGA